MLSIGFILLIVGVLIVLVSAFTPVPAPVAQIGWALLVVGVVLILLAYVLPMATVHTATALLTLL